MRKGWIKQNKNSYLNISDFESYFRCIILSSYNKEKDIYYSGGYSIKVDVGCTFSFCFKDPEQKAFKEFLEV